MLEGVDPQERVPNAERDVEQIDRIVQLILGRRHSWLRHQILEKHLRCEVFEGIPQSSTREAAWWQEEDEERKQRNLRYVFLSSRT
jgi:hypothetical protein